MASPLLNTEYHWSCCCRHYRRSELPCVTVFIKRQNALIDCTVDCVFYNRWIMIHVIQLTSLLKDLFLTLWPTSGRSDYTLLLVLNTVVDFYHIDMYIFVLSYW